MAEDRFANIFSVEVTLSAANTLTFSEMQFGITLRDKLAIVIDQVFIFMTAGDLSLFTANADRATFAITNSDAMTDITDYGDRRNMIIKQISRSDFGTAASGAMIQMPLTESFSPPMIALPTRMFFAADSAGLGNPLVARLRMHFRTVPITSEQQLTEVLESFQLST